MPETRASRVLRQQEQTLRAAGNATGDLRVRGAMKKAARAVEWERMKLEAAWPKD